MADIGTAPVDAFRANGDGVHNLTGNLWDGPLTGLTLATTHCVRGRILQARPEHGALRVTRGGSYLCHASYCGRYRVDARSADSQDASTGNLGFRVARDLGGTLA